MPYCEVCQAEECVFEKNVRNNTPFNSLADLQRFVCNSVPTPVKKEPDMNAYVNVNSNTDTDLGNQRDYLRNRAQDTYYKLDRDLMKQFFVQDDEPPKTLKDLKERLATGMFTIDPDVADSYEEDEDCSCYFDPFNWYRGIRWRNPANKKDCAGYFTAQKALREALVQVKDAIMINDPKEGLLALQSFETWVYKA